MDPRRGWHRNGVVGIRLRETVLLRQGDLVVKVHWKIIGEWQEVEGCEVEAMRK